MKKGFTLIELLAVIVILAIIALIATPIILGIINDAREKANERSVELYASAVRNGIAAYQLTNANAPTSFSDLNVQYDGKVECSVEELYEDGSFYLEGCKVNNGEKEYSYGTKRGSSIEAGKMSSVCKPISVQTEGTYTAGDKYECDVDPNKVGYDYIFYILNSTSTEVNLIMDSNINISGEAVKKGISDLGLVAWYADEQNNSYGPITAMNHLQEATSGWTNTNELVINKLDSCDIDLNYVGVYEMAEYVVNARMPYYSEINSYNSKTGAYAYLYNNLALDCMDENLSPTSCDEAVEKYGVLDAGIEHIQGVWGYWTLSPIAYFNEAWTVDFIGDIANRDVATGDDYGVRPVINLSISEI